MDVYVCMCMYVYMCVYVMYVCMYVSMYVVSVVYCQVELPASGCSLVQRIPTECGVSECDREARIVRRPWLAGGCWAMGKAMIEVSSLVLLQYF